MPLLTTFCSLLMIVSLSTANPKPVPGPTPTRLLASRATSCSSDNCLRAAQGDINKGWSYQLTSLCNAYTTASATLTTLTSSPLALPSECNASRISSLCSCLAPPPPPPSPLPCAANAPAQRVQNPSFENEANYYPNYYPWGFSDTACFSASSTDCGGNGNYDLYDNNAQDYQGSYGLTIWADGSSGVFQANQSLLLCAGTQYAFSAYIGYAFFYGPSVGPIFNSNVTVYFNNVVVVPTQPACTSTTQCNLPPPAKPSGYEVGFRQITGSIVGPPAGSPQLLKIVVSRNVSTNTNGAYGYDTTAETLLDLITVTKVS